MLWNPYRNFDKGMDDAYMGYEPQNTRNNQYMTGYEYAQELLSYDPNPDRSVATDDAILTDDGKTNNQVN